MLFEPEEVETVLPLSSQQAAPAAEPLPGTAVTPVKGASKRGQKPAVRKVAAKTPKKPVAIYQLKITLEHVKPPVWRRVEVKDCTLLQLNEIIQTSMGWGGYHMWYFDIAGEEYGDDFDAGDLDFKSASKAKLSRFAQAGVKKFRYCYDMGDNWDHVIQIEKVLEPNPQARYPRCVKGSRACPPEDCGGPWGYASLLETIQNPKAESHKEMLEWVGGSFDPEAFDLEAINEELAKE